MTTMSSCDKCKTTIATSEAEMLLEMVEGRHLCCGCVRELIGHMWGVAIKAGGQLSIRGWFERNCK